MASAWAALTAVMSYPPFGTYVLLQGLNLLLLRGWLRLLSMLPLPVAVAVFAFSAVAYAQESNLWPILLIPFARAALAYEMIISGIFAVWSLWRWAWK